MTTKKKTKKVEIPKNKRVSCHDSICGFSAHVVLVIVLALALGFLGGYMVKLVEDVGDGALDTVGIETEAFEPDLDKIAKMETIMEKLALYNTGQQGEVVFSEAEKKTVLRIVLLYDGAETILYISEDYQTILGAEAAQDVDELGASLDEALEALGLEYQGEENNEEEAETQAEIPEIQLFIMSDCPAGNMAEDNLLSVIKSLNGKMDFEPVYIISNYGGKYASLHGQYELDQDVREKLVFMMYGTQTWIDYVTAINEQCNSNNMKECWAEVAEQYDMDVEAIEAAFEEQFEDIVTSEAQKTMEAEITASPTLIVNGQYTKGAKNAESYQALICNGFLELPEECGEEVSSANSGSYGSCGN